MDMADNPNSTEYSTLRSGLRIYPSHEIALTNLLNGLVEHCPAHFAMLVEVSGQLLASAGEDLNTDHVALASLAAGDLAASQEMARLTGDYNAAHLVVREGRRFNTFLAEAGPHMVLFVQVGRDTPIGWARLLIQQAIRSAADILSAPAEEANDFVIDLGEVDGQDVLGDAFDALWND